MPELPYDYYYEKVTRTQWEALSDEQLEEAARADPGVGKYIRNWLRCWRPNQTIYAADICLRFGGDWWKWPLKPIQWDYDSAKARKETFLPGWGRVLVVAPITKVHAGEPRFGWGGSARGESIRWILQAVSNGVPLQIPTGNDAVNPDSDALPQATYMGKTGEWVILISDGHHRWEVAMALGETEIPVTMLVDQDEHIIYSKGLAPWKVLHLGPPMP